MKHLRSARSFATASLGGLSPLCACVWMCACATKTHDFLVVRDSRAVSIAREDREDEPGLFGAGKQPSVVLSERDGALMMEGQDVPLVTKGGALPGGRADYDGDRVVDSLCLQTWGKGHCGHTLVVVTPTENVVSLRRVTTPFRAAGIVFLGSAAIATATSVISFQDGAAGESRAANYGFGSAAVAGAATLLGITLWYFFAPSVVVARAPE